MGESRNLSYIDGGWKKYTEADMTLTTAYLKSPSVYDLPDGVRWGDIKLGIFYLNVNGSSGYRISIVREDSGLLVGQAYDGSQNPSTSTSYNISTTASDSTQVQVYGYNQSHHIEWAEIYV